jgi:hypothetical protein
MKIIHFNYPFHHTIINNFFEQIELDLIIDEIMNYDESIKCLDKHHCPLYENHNTISFDLDTIFKNNREDSKVLNILNKINDLDFENLSKENPFLGYYLTTNHDRTFVSKYKSKSSYFYHKDGSVLTFLFVIFLKPFNFGNLTFQKNNYVPNLNHNSLIIFPSYEIHKVSQIETETESNEYLRLSINKRYWILP